MVATQHGGGQIREGPMPEIKKGVCTVQKKGDLFVQNNKNLHQTSKSMREEGISVSEKRGEDKMNYAKKRKMDS